MSNKEETDILILGEEKNVVFEIDNDDSFIIYSKDFKYKFNKKEFYNLRSAFNKIK